MALPLETIKIIDFTQVQARPTCNSVSGFEVSERIHIVTQLAKGSTGRRALAQYFSGR